ncbi:hypothetical protein F2P81_011289 [Scophthalmus maximus]|uniref:Uncharacterized protein n=1 Tax=Scophthalmus maximus TaxID=52904 RepID=A0A6A4SRF7_SCOMX|nr:hypothetical protein F2P81_011289 [Scophthalmus maximus]
MLQTAEEETGPGAVHQQRRDKICQNARLHPPAITPKTSSRKIHISEVDRFNYTGENDAYLNALFLNNQNLF